MDPQEKSNPEPQVAESRSLYGNRWCNAPKQAEYSDLNNVETQNKPAKEEASHESTAQTLVAQCNDDSENRPNQ